MSERIKSPESHEIKTNGKRIVTYRDKKYVELELQDAVRLEREASKNSSGTSIMYLDITNIHPHADNSMSYQDQLAYDSDYTDDENDLQTAISVLDELDRDELRSSIAYLRKQLKKKDEAIQSLWARTPLLDIEAAQTMGIELPEDEGAYVREGAFPGIYTPKKKE